MTNTITLGGNAHNVAPLKALQVAEFYDAIEASENETKVQTITRSLRTVARSLRNAGSPLVEGLDEAQAIAKIDDVADWTEVDAAFGKVLEISGLKKAPQGEAPAAESTSNESSAAS